MWRAVALFCFAVIGAGAETAIKAESGPWTASLDGEWRWHAGDDLRWASPSFDDSDWPVLHVPGPVPQTRPYWIRLHVALGQISDPGLMLGPIAWAYEVYWDGQWIGSFGDLARGKWFVPRWQTFQVPDRAARPGAHYVAIRVGAMG